jgi:DNA polymerase-4
MPLRVLYVDMKSYFASVEQQLRPELRGRPVAVVAAKVDTTCCIAASYEAKRLGIRTGTPVWEAKKCRSLRIVEARPMEYVRIHHQIKRILESCLPVRGVHSIDEFSCRLFPAEAHPDVAARLAGEMKRAIAREYEWIKCSIGIAPNRLLAKVAADAQKPDGLTIFQEGDLPKALFRFALDDLPGIGPRMLKRLNRKGVLTIEQLYALDEEKMKQIWGGIVGQRWWHWLRGYDVHEPPTRRATVGHSHVLPPKLRTEDGARGVLIRMIHKVSARLRRLNYWAGRLEIDLSFAFFESGWNASMALGMCQDTQTMIQAFEALWPLRPKFSAPMKVAVTLHELSTDRSASLPLFPAERRRLKLARTMDRLNERFGPDTVYFGAMHESRQTAPTRIAFTQIPELTGWE